MASVSRRSDRAGWVTRWRDETGTQRKKSFSRKADADRFAAEVTHSLHTGSYVDPRAGRTTFREYAEAWRLAQPHRPNTASRVESQLRQHVYPVVGARPLSTLRTSQLQGMVSGWSLAPGSVRVTWSTVRSILRCAVRDRVLGRDPSDGVKLPAVERERVVPLAVDQVAALAAAVPPRLRALVMVGAGTGLRQGELLGLRVSDVDFLRRVVHVRQQAQNGVSAPLKNKASYRSVPVGAMVTDALAAHLAAYPAETYIFGRPDGQPLRRQTLTSAWNRARVAAGVPHATCHDLRHFYASALIRSGLSVKVVSERLGHSNAAMTLNVYAHLWPDDEDRTRTAIDTLFLPDVPRLRPAKGSSA
jgi:integrase